MSARSSDFFANTTTSVLIQLLVVLTAPSGMYQEHGAILAWFFCGGALLLALNGMHNVGWKQRLLAGVVAIFPALELLVSLYALIHENLRR